MLTLAMGVAAEGTQGSGNAVAAGDAAKGGASAAGGEAMAVALGVPFLGRIPLDPQLSRASESGVAAFRHAPASPGALALATVVTRLREQLAALPAQSEPQGTATAAQAEQDAGP